jgi:hypothetical protein
VRNWGTKWDVADKDDEKYPETQLDWMRVRLLLDTASIPLGLHLLEAIAALSAAVS